MPLWLFTDQYALVVPNIVQDIVIAIVVCKELTGPVVSN